MESFGAILGCSAGIALGGLVFAAYKFGLLYQLFHKVRSQFSTESTTSMLSSSSLLVRSI